jgi:hypothetical protein
VATFQHAFVAFLCSLSLRSSIFKELLKSQCQCAVPASEAESTSGNEKLIDQFLERIQETD